MQKKIFISGLLVVVALLLTGCGKKVPDIPEAKAEIITFEIKKIDQDQAKKLFLNTFYDYLISPVWKDSSYYSKHQTYYETVTNDYKFIGVQENKSATAESTLFLYESNMTFRKALAIFSFTTKSEAKAVYIKKINRYGLLISNAELSFAYGAIHDINTKGANWEYSMTNEYFSYTSSLWYDPVKDYMIWQSGEITGKDKYKQNISLTFLTKKDLEDFSSIFLSAFPIVKVK